MSISSRTPEGVPHRCPICGNAAALENSTTGDTCCPSCGQLLWWFRDRLTNESVNLSVSHSTSFVNDLQLDSLDLVELAMELEEEFELDIPDDVAERMITVGDVVCYIQSRRAA